MQQLLLSYGQNVIDPATLPNRVLDLDSEQGITLVSGKVDVWADQSGAGNHFAAPTAGFRPHYTTSALNGYPSVGSSGDGRRMIGPDIQLDYWTAFVVYKNTAPVSAFYHFCPLVSSDAPDPDRSFIIWGRNDASSIESVQFSSSKDGVNLHGASLDNQSPPNQWHIIHGISNLTNLTAWLDNSQTTQSSFGGPDKNSSFPMELFARTNGAFGDAASYIELVRVILFDTPLSVSTSTGIYNFLQQKYQV